MFLTDPVWWNANFALVALIAKPALVVALLFQVLPLLVLAERRGAAVIQDRPGPNRAYIQLPGWLPVVGGLKLRGFGMIFNLTDAVKLLFKESFTATFAHKWWYILAPAIPVVAALLTPSVLPWFGPLIYQDTPGQVAQVSGQVFDVNVGLLLFFAIGSLSVYGVVLGSWASNSKFSLLGGMRASAMMISYEVSMGLSVLGLILIIGDFGLTSIVEWQTAHTWGIVVQPIGFMLFLVSMFAECNRNPFDVAEGESEIVAGFHTEFASSKFMLFMTAEYLHVLIASALIATLYLGGYSLLPFPLPVGGKEGLEWMTLDTAWVQGHLNLIGGAMLSLGGLTLVGLSWLVGRHKRAYARLGASDAADRLREFGFFAGLFMILGLFSLAGGAACLLLEPPAPVAGLYYQAKPVYPLWVNLVTAVVQLHVVLGKTLAVAWLFIWVRWTLPRFRYDQIMALGWKVMLNIALVNLLVTALIAKLVR
jgi:NADH-quinone oxidoreductase subunit H